MQTLARLMVATFCLVLAGCGGGEDQLETFAAHGTATFAGRPMQDARITLHPIDGEPKARLVLPRGKVGPDGTYAVGTYQVGDGAPAGRYKATIVWIEEDDSPVARPGVSADRLGGRYSSAAKSTIEVIIEETDNELPPIELK